MNGIALEDRSGLSAPGPVAENLSTLDGIAAAAIVRRLAVSGLGENGKKNEPQPADDQAEIVTTIDGVTVSITQRGGWYVGPGRRGVLRNCDHCGRVYEARRSTSRFCSVNCRVFWSRDRHGLPVSEPEAE